MPGSKAGLLTAATHLATTNYAVSLTSGGETSIGTVDPAAKAATLHATATVDSDPIEIDALLISPHIWVKMDLGSRNETLGTDPKMWMKVDPAKLTSATSLPFDTSNWADPLGVKGLLTGVTSGRVDAGHYTGTIDLTRARGPNAPGGAEISAMGAAAKAVPFTATLDPQGRFIEITIDGSGLGKDLSFDLQFSDYGTAAPVTRPDDTEVTDMPAGAYTMLNGG